MKPIDPSVRLISVTRPVVPLNENPDDLSPESVVIYCARASSEHQSNPEYVKLLRSCLKNKHWSVFDMADMTVEIVTSRDISAQIIRHKSFFFQEFSQRYSEVPGYIPIKARRQAATNRQSSVDDLDYDAQKWWCVTQDFSANEAFKQYQEALSLGIARENARSLLPMSAATKIYMKGSIRSWIHYLEVRCSPSTQAEHRTIAEAIREIFKSQFPLVAQCLEDTAP